MRRGLIVAAGLVAAGGAGIALLTAGDAPAPARPDAERRLATVERRDLVERESVDGTLGYDDAGVLTAGAAGTLTRLRREGEVLERGDWTAEVDGARTGWLLYGRRPAWREFSPGMSDGADVRQLEANLAALGHRPGTVDGDWDSATTAAVRRFQAARDLDVDGTLGRSEIVFRRGATRVGAAEADPGDGVRPGAPLVQVTSTRRVVTIELAADRQELARRGDDVTVDLPDATTARGRISAVAKVARRGRDENDPATVDVTVTLRGKAARGTGLDQAPVEVGLALERRRDVLVVPVAALVARPGGGYAVEDAGGRLIPVEPGLFADGLVEVDGVAEGARVVVPA